MQMISAAEVKQMREKIMREQTQRQKSGSKVVSAGGKRQSALGALAVPSPGGRTRKGKDKNSSK